MINGTSLYAQDPTAVHNWLLQFTGYSDVDVDVDTTADLQTLAVGSASATANAQYQGATYASTTVSWDYNTTPPSGGCDTPICPNQN